MASFDNVVPWLALLGLFLGGIALAYLVGLAPPRHQRMAEVFALAAGVGGAVVLDLLGEGASHGVFAWSLLSLPALLSFSILRFVLTRRLRSHSLGAA